MKEGKATGVVKEGKDGKEKKMGKTTGETMGRFSLSLTGIFILLGFGWDFTC